MAFIGFSFFLCLKMFIYTIIYHIYYPQTVPGSYFLREHRIQEGKVVFPLGVSVHGDVVVSVYHMRSTIGGRLQAKVMFLIFLQQDLS